MADNITGYKRFGGYDVAREFGRTVEEIKLQRGNPDRNPAASPLAVPRLSQERLALKPRGSDQLRLALPEEPGQNDYEGPQSILGLSRGALRKLRAGILTDFQAQVRQVSDPQTRSLMLGSLRQVSSMDAYLHELFRMTENVYARRRSRG